MQRQAWEFLGALVLVIGTWFASNLVRNTPAEAPADAAPLITPVAVETPLDPTEQLLEIDLKTGDSFWGLHLDGVIPCSTMLVKGGGHLLMLSHADRPDLRCYYQIKDPKIVELDGRTFRVTITEPDRAHVTRIVPEHLADNL
jgi:hypothetical protein